MDSGNNPPKHDKTTENIAKKPTLPPIQQLTNGQVFEHRVLNRDNQLNSSTTTGNTPLTNSSDGSISDQHYRPQQQEQQQAVLNSPVIHTSLPHQLHISQPTRLLPIEEHHPSQPNSEAQQIQEQPQSQQLVTTTTTTTTTGKSRPKLVKKYFCKICSQGFTRKHNMVSHELIHSSLKPHICKVCNLRFRRIHDLKRHEKLHTGEKPYACSKCSRRFARPDALTRHQNSANACTGLSGSAYKPVIEGEDGSTSNLNRRDSFDAPGEGYSLQNSGGVIEGSSSGIHKRQKSIGDTIKDDNLNPRPPLHGHSASLPPQPPYSDPNHSSRAPLQHSHSTPAASVPYQQQQPPPPPAPPHPPASSQLPSFSQHGNANPNSGSPSLQQPPPPQAAPPHGHFFQLVPPLQTHIPQPQSHLPYHPHLIGGGPPTAQPPPPPPPPQAQPPQPLHLHYQGQTHYPHFPYISYPHHAYQPQQNTAIPSFLPLHGSPVSAPPHPPGLDQGQYPIPITPTNQQHSQSAPPLASHRIPSISVGSPPQPIDLQQRSATTTSGDSGTPSSYRPYDGIASSNQPGYAANYSSQQTMHSPRVSRQEGISRQPPPPPPPLKHNHGESSSTSDIPNKHATINGYLDHQPREAHILPHMRQHNPTEPISQGGIQPDKVKQSVSGPTETEDLNQGQAALPETGQFIPYSRYQELYKYTQSLQDSLAELNNRINNLEKKDEDKDKT